MKNHNLFLLFFVTLTFIACKKNDGEPATSSNNANLILKFKFDPTQVRLNNIGGVSIIPPGNAAQNPTMNKMSAHYVELTPNALTALGAGAVIYKAPETNLGGSTAIDFSKAILVGNNEIFLSVPIKDIVAGTYEYLRVSLAYQNLDVSFHLDTVINTTTISQDFPATIAGFIGFNTYINGFTIKNQTVPVHANKLQGFWGAEISGAVMGFPFSNTSTGQAPSNATTVVNPIFATSPVPQGSCLVTGAFAGGSKLHITGAETNDIVVVVSLSTNKSFEWTDTNGNGKWDVTKGEKIVDMGLRGMIATIQ